MPAPIRSAHGSDLPYFYDICLKTGNCGKNAEGLFSDPYLIGQYYAAPYLFHDPALCFIAESCGRPAGYIIGAADTTAFDSWFESEWLPILRRRYPPERPAVSAIEGALIAAVNRRVEPPNHIEAPWYPRHPAHLHIDLLPELQGQGCGRALVERFFEAMRQLSVPGIHLGVDGRNAKAIAFYRKIGFVLLREESWGLTMGLEF